MRDSTIGERVRALREKRGFTQEELAQRAGLHRVQIAQVEGDRYRSPRLETLRRLAKALKVSLAELVE